MKISKRGIGFSVSAGLVALALVWLTVYVLSGVSEAITLNGYGMKSLQKEWLLDGSPEPPPVEKYTAHGTDPTRFFVWTNTYAINGNSFQSLFGMNDPRFEGKGILVISSAGKLIWVDRKKGAKIVKDER